MPRVKRGVISRANHKKVLAQAKGYRAMFDRLERALAEITGFHAVSLQPNAGSQGEYAGLLVIRAWQEARGQAKRNVCLIPASALCSVGGGILLRADAARGFRGLDAAYRAEFGSSICVSGGYRDLATQQRLFAEKPGLAAVPGTSNHGWGVAVDLCGGIESFSSSKHAWMKANAGRFGWVHPSWARQGGGREEPWHWEYGT